MQNSHRNKTAKLSTNQQAIFDAISKYSKFPIDGHHLRVEIKNGSTCLLFTYQATSELEFDVFAEFFEDSFALHCDGWHDEFVIKKCPNESATRILEKLKSIFEGKIKVRVTYAGKSPYKWEILFDEGIDWEVLPLTGLFFYNYLGKRKTIEKVNRIII